MQLGKRLRVEVTAVGAPPRTVPATPPASPPAPAGGPGLPSRRGTGAGSGGGGARDSRQSPLSPEEKVRRILQRHGRSFCEDLGIHLHESNPAGLWQWLCASVLFSARIKSAAAVEACAALFRQGLATPQAFQHITKEQCRVILHGSGYDRYDDKAAGFLVDDAAAVVREYGGDLSRLRAVARRDPEQERQLLKRMKGIGDGGVDIFFREVQLIWDELYPFADKKALKAARLVGLHEHPRSLAELCGNDRQTYVRLVAALVRIELSKAYHEF